MSDVKPSQAFQGLGVIVLILWTVVSPILYFTGLLKIDPDWLWKPAAIFVILFVHYAIIAAIVKKHVKSTIVEVLQALGEQQLAAEAEQRRKSLN